MKVGYIRVSTEGQNNVVFLRGQYSGLTERNGIPVPFPCANKKDGTVEVRELSVYDQLLGGASCG